MKLVKKLINNKINNNKMSIFLYQNKMTLLNDCIFSPKNYQKILTGIELNELNKQNLSPRRFFKFINKEKKHNGFSYVDGLNSDTNDFNPTKECSIGGLYFTTIDYIYKFRQYGSYLCEIIIPDDALCYIECTKIKANKIFIKSFDKFKSIMHISSITDEELLFIYYNNMLTFANENNNYVKIIDVINILFIKYDIYELHNFNIEDNNLITLYKQLIKHDVQYMKYIKPYATIDLYCKLASQSNESVVLYMNEEQKTVENYEKIIESAHNSIYYIDEQYYSTKMIEHVVKKNALFFRCLANKWKTLDICLISVQKNSQNIDYIDSSMYEQLIECDGCILTYLNFETDFKDKNKLHELCKIAINNNQEVFKHLPNDIITQELCDMLIKNKNKNTSHICYFEYVPEQFRTDELCQIVINKHPKLLELTPNKLKTYDMCFKCILDGASLEHVPEEIKTLKLCQEAVSTTHHNLQYVPEKYNSRDLYLCALNKDGHAIQYIENQTEEFCLISLEYDASILCYIESQYRTPNVCMFAVKKDAIKIRNIEEDKQTHEICLHCVKENGLLLEYIYNPNDEIYEEAVKQNPYALKYISAKNQKTKLCVMAVKQNGLVLEYLHNDRKTNEVCLLAVEQNPYSWNFIKIDTIIDKTCEYTKKKTTQIIKRFNDLQISIKKNNPTFEKYYAQSHDYECGFYENQVEEITKILNNKFGESLIIYYGDIENKYLSFNYIMCYEEDIDYESFYYQSKKDVFVSDKQYGTHPHFIGIICIDVDDEEQTENQFYILYLDKTYNNNEIDDIDTKMLIQLMKNDKNFKTIIKNKKYEIDKLLDENTNLKTDYKIFNVHDLLYWNEEFDTVFEPLDETFESNFFMC